MRRCAPSFQLFVQAPDGPTTRARPVPLPAFLRSRSPAAARVVCVKFSNPVTASQVIQAAKSCRERVRPQPAGVRLARPPRPRTSNERPPAATERNLQRTAMRRAPIADSGLRLRAGILEGLSGSSEYGIAQRRTSGYMKPITLWRGSGWPAPVHIA